MSPEKNEILTSNTETSTLSSLDKIKALKAEKELERQAKADQQKIEEENGEKAVSSFYNSEKEGLSGMQNRKGEIENRLDEIKAERGNIISSGHEAREEAEKDEDVKEIIHSEEGFNDVFAGEKKEWGNLREEVTALNQELKELEAALLIKGAQVKELFEQTKGGKEKLNQSEKMEKAKEIDRIANQYLQSNNFFVEDKKVCASGYFVKFEALASLGEEDKKTALEALKHKIPLFIDDALIQRNNNREPRQKISDEKLKEQIKYFSDLTIAEIDRNLIHFEVLKNPNFKDLDAIKYEDKINEERKMNAQSKIYNLESLKELCAGVMSEKFTFDIKSQGRSLNIPLFSKIVEEIDQKNSEIKTSEGEIKKMESDFTVLKNKKVGMFGSEKKHEEEIKNLQNDLDKKRQSYKWLQGQVDYLLKAKSDNEARIEGFFSTDRGKFNLKNEAGLESGMTLAEMLLNVENFLLKTKETNLSPEKIEILNKAKLAQDAYDKAYNKVKEFLKTL